MPGSPGPDAGLATPAGMAGLVPPVSRGSLSRADLAILTFAFAMLVVWSPLLNAGLTTPRVALLAVALGPGLVVLAGAVRQGDRGAWWATGFLGWSIIAAVGSSEPKIALIGTYGSELGWVYLAGYLACWALGRRLSDPARVVLVWVVLAGVAANAVMAVLEAAFEPSGLLAMLDGRASGLTQSSLYLGGLVAGAMAMAAHRAMRTPGRLTVALVLLSLFAAAANLSGSRAALVGGFGAAMVAAGLALRPTGASAALPGRSVARLGACALALAFGVLVSLPLGTAGGSTERVAAVDNASGGYVSRAEMWRIGVDAVADRPLVGYGPGRFRAATSSRVTPTFTRAEGPDKLFFDAHNLAVEHLVGSGVPGVLLLGGFTLTAARRARGPLAWFVSGVALTWLVTPVAASTGPVAMLALGAAWAARARATPGPAPVTVAGRPLARSVGALLAVGGLLIGGTMVIGDAVLHDGLERADPARIQQAQRFYPPDPVLSDVEGQAWALDVDTAGPDEDPRASTAAVRAAQRAVDLDPTRPKWWVNLGFARARYGTGTEAERLDQAEAAFLEALERNPWSVAAMTNLRQVAELRGDDAEAQRWQTRLCQVTDCPPG